MKECKRENFYKKICSEAEKAALGSLILESFHSHTISDTLKSDHFLQEEHVIIFNAICGLYEKCESFNCTDLIEKLAREKQLEQVGGSEYIHSLINNVNPMLSDLYASVVREKSILRRIVKFGDRISQLGHDGFKSIKSVNEILAICRAELTSIERSFIDNDTEIIPMRLAIKDMFQAIDSRYKSRGSVTGLPTGFKEFDNITSGFQTSDFIVVAARTRVGKTSFVMNIAKNVALNEGKTVGIIGLGESVEQLTERILCAMSRIDYISLQKGFVTDNDWTIIFHCMDKLQNAPIVFADSQLLSVFELYTKAKQMKVFHGIQLLIIDGIQSVVPSIEWETNDEKYSEISRWMKVLAQEHDIPIVVTYQIGGSEESQPETHDLMYTGTLSNSASMIVFLNRYMGDEDDIMEVSIRKHNTAPSSKLKLRFKANCFSIEDYTD